MIPQTSTDPQEMFARDKFKREIVIEWDELRSEFIRVAGGGRHPQPAFGHVIESAEYMQSFYGDDVKGMVDKLEHGFTSPEIQGAEAYVKEIRLPQIIWDEEGENVDVCAALAGDDEPFFQWEDIPHKPGIKIVAELAFLGSTNVSVIGEYGAWLAGLIANLEGEGVDVELDIAMPSERGMLTSDHRSQNQVIIRVKRAGEVRDFADYSALFSPGGFRILGFCARAMAAEAWGLKCDMSFGSSKSREWGVAWDDVERTLYVTRPACPRDFPAEAMTAQLAECGIE